MTEERNGNQVFSALPQGVDPRIPTTTAAGQVKADFGLEIPVETVPLPSAGRIYPVTSRLHGKETLEIRAGTAREEDILTSQALLKKGTVINELIRSCLVDKGIDPAELTMGDKNALMVAIRITMYGAEYEAEVECKECSTKSPQTFNLGELPIKRLAIDPVTDGMNLFEFTLPYLKKTVKFKFLTGRDDEEMSTIAAKQKKLNMQSDAGVTTSLQYSIISIDGIEDRAKIAAFVRMMPARDSLALRNYIKDNDPGLVMKQEVKCSSCGHEESVGMPIGINFLWPGAGR
jgi:hypothetical protein